MSAVSPDGELGGAPIAPWAGPEDRASFQHAVHMHLWPDSTEVGPHQAVAGNDTVTQPDAPTDHPPALYAGAVIVNDPDHTLGTRASGTRSEQITDAARAATRWLLKWLHVVD